MTTSTTATTASTTTATTTKWWWRKTHEKQQHQKQGSSSSSSCRGCFSIEPDIFYIDYVQGDKICTNCGVVNEEHIMDPNPEWREFHDDVQMDGRNTVVGSSSSSSARTGFVPVDETKYIGGLQPTTLSKYVWGGPLAAIVEEEHSSKRGTTSSNGVKNIRQRLYATNRKMDHIITKMQTRDIQSVLLSKRIQQQQQRRRKKQSKPSNKQKEGEEEDDDDDDTTVTTTDMDTNTTSDSTRTILIVDDHNTMIRPEYVQLLEIEEEYVSRMQMALHADKWSFTRAIQLFGRPDQQSEEQQQQSQQDEDHSISTSSSLLFTKRRGKRRQRHDNTTNRTTTKYDSVLQEASRDLYMAYSILENAVQRLELPDRVLQEATNMLCQYAMKCDSLSVKGIASNISSSSSKRRKDYHSIMDQTATTSTIGSDIPLDNTTQKQYNKMKQIGALCSGLLFLIARNMGYPRSMIEVCQSIHISDAIQIGGITIHDDMPNINSSNHDSFIIQKKHCSKAMNDIKEHFTEFDNQVSTVVTTTQTLMTATPTESVVSTSLSQIVNNSTVVTNSSNLNVPGALGNFTDHTLRKLTLPPVAEACVRCLVVYWQYRPDSPADNNNSSTNQKNKQKHNNTGSSNNKLSTICAALGYFACVTGTIMQQLAQQAKKRHATTIATKVTISSPRDNNNTDGDEAIRPKRIKLTESPLYHDTIGSLDLLRSQQQQQQQQQQLDNPIEFNDMNDDASSISATAEHREYEMRRMWDAWSEQTSWARTLGDVEQSSGVPRATILDFYKRHLHPERNVLLQVLCDSVNGGSSNSNHHDMDMNRRKESHLGTGDISWSLQQEQNLLNNTPLASILLHYISIAAPLMKLSPQL